MSDEPTELTTDTGGAPMEKLDPTPSETPTPELSSEPAPETPTDPSPPAAAEAASKQPATAAGKKSKKATKGVTVIYRGPSGALLDGDLLMTKDEPVENVDPELVARIQEHLPGHVLEVVKE